MAKKNKTFDVTVVGGGLTGLATAAALCQLDLDVGLFAPENTGKDPRTTALFETSLDILEKHGVGANLRGQGHPLKIMRIVDGTKRLLRAPEVSFSAEELDLAAFGYNFPNDLLLDHFEQLLSTSGNLTRIPCNVENVELAESGITMLAEGKIYKTTVLAGCDGRNSVVRRALGIEQRRWSYPQSAIVLDFEHQYSSQSISTEFHTEHGPFTIVPKSDYLAGLVWVERPEIADEYLKLGLGELSREVEARMQSFLGKVSIVSRPAAFPLSGMVANRLGKANMVLLGEAAHVFPPIGAQGFNLGIRDMDTFGDLLQHKHPGDAVGDAYHLARQSDVNRTTSGVDLLNRLLLNGFLPVQIARTAGLAALERLPKLRKLVMNAGISASFSGLNVASNGNDRL